MNEDLLMERVRKKIQPEPMSGCWLWSGAIKSNGYGHFAMSGGSAGSSRFVHVHRYVYETLIGPIPAGLQIDHLCRNRACCNPEHLEPVSPGENILRGVLPELTRARHAQVTHCPKGHAYDEANTIPPGLNRWGRGCRACQREWTRSHYKPRGTA